MSSNTEGSIRSVSGVSAALESAGVESHIISGECRNSVQEIAVTGEVEFGVWEGTPGSWRSEWQRWEFFTVLSGRGSLVDGAGTIHRLEPGACVWIPEGSTGLWIVEETVRKSYVIPTQTTDRQQ